VPALTLLERIDALTAALTAAQPAGGPARRIKSDFGPKGDKQKKGGSGRRVASKAGEKRYGLPIGTPLGQTGSRRKNDRATQASYNTFMAAKTPADLNKAASWMSNDDLKRAGEALFSFASKNERDEAARISLVKELAARGINPASLGYRGGPVVLNPNPKKDPVAEAANRKKRDAETARSKAQRDADKRRRDAEREADRKAREKARTEDEQREAEADRAEAEAIRKAGDALATGQAEERELREQLRARQRARAAARAG
jgi:hypothetical protein